MCGCNIYVQIISIRWCRSRIIIIEKCDSTVEHWYTRYYHYISVVGGLCRSDHIRRERWKSSIGVNCRELSSPAHTAVHAKITGTESWGQTLGCLHFFHLHVAGWCIFLSSAPVTLNHRIAIGYVLAIAIGYVLAIAIGYVLAVRPISFVHERSNFTLWS